MSMMLHLRKRLKVRPKNWAKCLVGLLLVGVFWLAWGSLWAGASTLSQVESTENCLMCHADPDFVASFQDGELISLYVNRTEYENSVHGPAGLNCVACHTDLTRYPHHSDQNLCTACHPKEGGQPDTTYVALRGQLTFADRRELTLTINEACRSCHEQEFAIAGDSAHVRVLEGGNLNAPACVDCHGSHNTVRFGERPRAEVSDMCGSCHMAVYSTYRTSVHGAALDAESNPDVPTCIECHGVHSVRGPRDSPYRNDSISVCGGCHGDRELMQKYGLSAAVFQTYLDDFHGRTVDLFRRQGAGTQSHKAVCFDCHGIHNIRQIDDPLSTVYPTNLQHTCQQCHTDANIMFPSAWLSHYLPTWEDTPILFLVNLAYQILTPLTIGGFLVYIGLDASRRWLERRQAIRRIRTLAEKELEDYDFANDIPD
ncbi:MAG: cytochrome C [Chloroflexi bacterium]|nr:cytochrome C [Chloroflexota bacterium]MBU1751129.1 cytochrome C [Chloroflexota bacterium]